MEFALTVPDINDELAVTIIVFGNILLTLMQNIFFMILVTNTVQFTSNQFNFS